MSRHPRPNFITWENLVKQIQGAETGEGGSKEEVGHNSVDEVGVSMVLYKAASMDCEVMVQDKMDEVCKEEDVINKKETKRWIKWPMAF